MNKKLNLPKYHIKNKLILLLSLTMIFLGFFIFNQTYPLNSFVDVSENLIYFLYKPFSFIDDSIKDLIHEIKISRSANKEIEDLKKKLNRLNNSFIDYYDVKKENERLLKINEIKKDLPSIKHIYANVCARSPLNNYGNFIINVGSDNGISLNDPVISENGFVGVISRVSSNISFVKTILSPEIKLGGISFETNGIGITKGNKSLAKKSLLEFYNLRSIDSVNVGDTIKTTGASGIYPENIKIGKVEKTGYDTINSNYYAIIKPFEENIKELRNVYVIIEYIGKNFIKID